jgi:hypothetical protein
MVTKIIPVPNGIKAMIGTIQWMYEYDVNASHRNDIGQSTAPANPMISLVSGGGFPLYLSDWRQYILPAGLLRKRKEKKATAAYLFQIGCVKGTMVIPIPSPRNETPTNSCEKPCSSPKMIGKT